MSKKLEKLTVKDNSLWKVVKNIKNKIKPIPTLHGKSGLAFGDEEKAREIGDHFEQVHHITEDLGDYETERLVDNTYSNIKTKEILIEDINLTSPKEIKKIIQSTKSKKAPGYDEIQNIILKNLPKTAIVQLTYIFNSCLKTSYFPQNWKMATILPIQKAEKNKLFPQNYRPISLLPTISKIFERVILNRLKNHEAEHKQLIPEQFGFRERIITLHQLALLTDYISTNFNTNHSTAVAYLDMEKAFDTVWHKGLVYKLTQLNYPMYLTKNIH